MNYGVKRISTHFHTAIQALLRTQAMLGVLAQARNASEFHTKIPETLNVLREYIRKVRDHECALSDMIFETRVSRECDDYRQFNDR